MNLRSTLDLLLFQVTLPTEEERIQRRENNQVTKLVVIVTGTFALCVLPYHIVGLLYEFHNVKHMEVFTIRSLVRSSLTCMDRNEFSDWTCIAIGSRNFWMGQHQSSLLSLLLQKDQVFGFVVQRF